MVGTNKRSENNSKRFQVGGSDTQNLPYGDLMHPHYFHQMGSNQKSQNLANLKTS